MRILHIIPTYVPAPESTGPVTAIHNLNKELVKLGLEVVVYTTNSGGSGKLNVPLAGEVLVDGVRVFYFPVTFGPWQYSFRLHQALKKNVGSFDLIHVSSMFLSFLTLASIYARRHRIPYVVSPHGMLMLEPLKSKAWKKRFYTALFEKKNIENAEFILFTTELEKKESELAGLQFQNTAIVPHGVSIASEPLKKSLFRTKYRIPEGKKIVLFLGRLNWVKGFEALLYAFAKVMESKSDAVLVLAGPDGGYKKKIKELAQTFQIQKDVIFTGELDTEGKSEAFAESYVFVLPSVSENFSVATVEAMSAGLPVVVTEGVGISSLIKKYKAGIVVQRNPLDLSRALLSILTDEELAQTMGARGKVLAREEFAVDKVAKRMLEVYKNIIKQAWSSKGK